ncbi:30S ribosomal protein S4 [Candidatus Microgenomates bacterium]|nr:30S ribosomal protein S4 [Candidatus Microgenomates bacterium]
MARYTGPKNKLARREKIDLEFKTPGTSAHASLLKRLNISPGVHGQKRARKPSDYSVQLREKQKVKRIYGLLEKQFKKYFFEALKKKAAAGEELLKLLEKRLDNVVYRLGFTPTRASARQLIVHGHILVNGRKITIPSYRVSIEETINFRDKSLKIPMIKKKLSEKNPIIPSWLKRKGPVGKMANEPQREDNRADINEQLIVEYYSR